MAFLRFVAWLGTQAWKYGSKLASMIRYAYNNRPTVVRWLERFGTFATVAELIYRAVS